MPIYLRAGSKKARGKHQHAPLSRRRARGAAAASQASQVPPQAPSGGGDPPRDPSEDQPSGEAPRGGGGGRMSRSGSDAARLAVAAPRQPLRGCSPAAWPQAHSLHLGSGFTGFALCSWQSPRRVSPPGLLGGTMQLSTGVAALTC